MIYNILRTLIHEYVKVPAGLRNDKWRRYERSPRRKPLLPHDKMYVLYIPCRPEKTNTVRSITCIKATWTQYLSPPNRVIKWFAIVVDWPRKTKDKTLIKSRKTLETCILEKYVILIFYETRPVFYRKTILRPVCLCLCTDPRLVLPRWMLGPHSLQNI